jgi:hypothetical protein
MKYTIRNMLLALVFLIPVHASSAPNAQQQKQLSLIKQQAEKGNAKAMVAMGYAYEKGEIVSANAKEAGVWFQRASDKGSSTGMVNLALLYTNGEGVTKDHQKAFSLFEKAANLNDITGFYYLARCYTEGLVVEENFLVTYSLLTLILAEGKGKYDRDSFVVKEGNIDDETEYIKANVYAAAQEILSLMEPDLLAEERGDVESLTQAMSKKGQVTNAIKAFIKNNKPAS